MKTHAQTQPSAEREDRDRPRQMERQIRAIRDDLDSLVTELDRRRHEALDWRVQVRRHQRPLWIAAGVVGLGIGGYATLQLRRRRRHRGFARRARDLAHALRLVAEHPQALARTVENGEPRSRLASASLGIARSALPLVARTLMQDRRRASSPR